MPRKKLPHPEKRGLKCSNCGLIKHTSEFYNAPKNKNRLGKHSYCKACCDLKFNRLRNYKEKYGITIKDYEVYLMKQDGKCAICKKEDTTKLAVDHRHSDGKVRGLLCKKCNLAIGLFHDDISILFSAIEYLSKSSG